MNTVKTILLLGCLMAVMVIIGEQIGGKSGMYAAFALAVITNLASYWFSASIALSMAGAKPVERSQAPNLYRIVEGLARKANIPVPRIYIIPSSSANAFATGRDPSHAAIAVTEGILNLLNDQEIEAVLSHELGHVRNRDILISTMAAVLASAITTIAHWGMYFGSGDNRENRNPIFVLLLLILAPMAAALINLAISRSREYEADATGAHICGDPLALASALAKVDQASQVLPMNKANPALSSLFLVKPNPSSWFVNFLSTHPPTIERIKRLQEINREMRS